MLSTQRNSQFRSGSIPDGGTSRADIENGHGAGDIGPTQQHKSTDTELQECLHMVSRQESEENRQLIGTAEVVRSVVYTAVIVILALVLIIIGLLAGFKTFGRYQARANAHNAVTTSQIAANNRTKLNQIQIAQTAQLVKVAAQQAQIRNTQAQGIREAQDRISGTLTPLYVQFEMVQALQQIAQSGKNSSVVYIPTGANGIPLISGAAGQSSVGLPATGK
jgi:hypothetical protein